MRNKLEISAAGAASTGFCPDQVGGGKKRGVGGEELILCWWVNSDIQWPIKFQSHSCN